MKLFLSWSKPQSRAVAELLRTWVPDVIQAVTPWMSQLDIDPGSRWSREISEQLAAHDIGIVCVTPQNLGEPWLHFEAGSVSKSVQRGILIPVLHDVTVADIQPTPLAQFQCVHSREADEMWHLVERLNEQLEIPLSSERLRKYFDASWPGYLEKLDQLDEGVESASAPMRESNDLLNDILVRLSSHSSVLETIVERLGFTFVVGEVLETSTAATIPPTLRTVPEVPEPSTDPFALRPGDYIRHPSFGDGIIIEIQGSGQKAEATIRFDDVGTKHLALAWAPLRLLEDGAPPEVKR